MIGSGLLQLLAFLVGISLLVTVHEFGHYWVARRLGFKVLRFSIGFGKVLYRRLGANGVEFVVCALPLGGYVKMLDEREPDEPIAAADLPAAFTRRPHWQRIAVLLAGPAFNILFAILVLTGLRLSGGLNFVRPVLGAVAPGSVAASAGLRAGDEIVRIDGREIDSQSAAVIGLLDAISGTSTVTIAVRGADGRVRETAFDLPDATQRRRLTEPELMFEGLGLQMYEPPIPAVLGTVEPDGPAARAGLRAGDEIVSVDGTPVHDFLGFTNLIRARPGASVVVGYRRGGQSATTTVAVLSQPGADGRPIGRIRVQIDAARIPVQPLPPGMLRHVDLSLFGALREAGSETWTGAAFQGRMLWRMLSGHVSMKNLSGPLGIAKIAGASAAAGVSAFLGFLAIISLALGLMNLLPIPILDGGQIVMQAIEWLRGRPMPERFWVIGQQVGVALLVLLMSVALFNDVARRFG